MERNQLELLKRRSLNIIPKLNECCQVVALADEESNFNLHGVFVEKDLPLLALTAVDPESMESLVRLEQSYRLQSQVGGAELGGSGVPKLI